MSYNLIILPNAESDIDSVRADLECRQAGLGDKFLRSLGETFDLLRDNPFINAILRNRVRVAIVRRFRYLVFYRIEQGNVSVYAVIHGKRDPKLWRLRIP